MTFNYNKQFIKRFKTIIFLLGLLICSQLSYAAGLTLSAGDVLNLGNDHIKVQGDIVISANSTLKIANGSIYLTGNWINKGTFTAGNGMVIFNGTSEQTITSTSVSTQFNHLVMSNKQGLLLKESISVGGFLTFNEGFVTLDDFDLTMGGVNKILNASATKFFITNKKGLLIQKGLSNIDVLFPIGFSTTSYTPILLNNSGTQDDYGVSVGSTFSKALLTANDALKLQWHVTEGTSGGSNLKVKTFWNARHEGSNFSRDKILLLGVLKNAQYNVFAKSSSDVSGSFFSAEFNNINNPADVTNFVLGNPNSITSTPPVMGVIANQTQNEDFTEYSLTLSASDIDNDPITFSASSSNKALLDISVSGSKLTITPIANANGVTTITTTATANGGSHSQSFTVTINPVNDAPTINSIASQTGTEKEIFSLVAGTSVVNDIDSQDLTVTATLQNTSALPTWLKFNSGDVSFQGIPPEGEAGSFVVRVTVDDGALSSSNDFTVTIAKATQQTETQQQQFDVINKAFETLTFDRIKVNNLLAINVTSNLDLITTLGLGDAISWNSTDINTIDNAGVVIRGVDNTVIQLTANISFEGKSISKTFLLTVTGTGLTDTQILAQASDALTFSVIALENLKQSEIYTKLDLVSLYNRYSVSWASSNANVIDNLTGLISRQTTDQAITLTATLTQNNLSTSKTFDLTVKKQITNASDVLAADLKLLDTIKILDKNRDIRHIIFDLNLPTSGVNGSVISWLTSDTVINSSSVDVINSTGGVTRQTEEVTVLLTSTLTFGGQVATKQILLTVLASEDKVIQSEDIDSNISFKNKEETTNTSGNLETKINFANQQGSDVSNVMEFDNTLTTTTTQSSGGFETESTVANGATKVEKIITYQNTNGTAENVVTIKKDNGDTYDVRVSSQDTGINTNINKDGEVTISKATTSGEIKALVSLDGLIQHVVQLGTVQTKAQSSVPDTEVEIQTNGSVITTSRVVNTSGSVVKIDITGQTDGLAVHTMNIGSDSTTASIKVTGAQTLIDSLGNINTSVDTGNVQIVVSASQDGTSAHKVTFSGQVTQATSDIVGADTSVESDGSVTTTASVSKTISGSQFVIKLTVVTDNDGRSRSKFVKQLSTGESIEIQNTVDDTTPFDAGNKISIKEQSGVLIIEVETSVSTPLVF
jgi:hypothetical protein